MSPENAYLSVLEEDFNEDHIPTLNTLPFPVKGVKLGYCISRHFLF